VFNNRKGGRPASAINPSVSMSAGRLTAVSISAARYTKGAGQVLRRLCRTSDGNDYSNSLGEAPAPERGRARDGDP